MQNRTLRILVIDDDEDICAALKSIFEFQQWRVYTANRVRYGLELLRSERPDIILIDYHMPEINGIYGVRMIRNLNMDIPIVVLTIDEDQEVADRFLEAGANDFALKPVKALDIISRIKLHIQLMNNRKSKADSAVKGIVTPTLHVISRCLKDHDGFMTTDELSEETGLAYPTAYRYLQYMIDQDLIEIQTSYGKVGRPKQSYRLKE